MHVNDILDRPDLQYQQERFFKYVDWSGGPLACWPYLGRVSQKGYGKHFIGDHGMGAHRVAYVLASAQPLPPDIDGKETCVLHRCDNPICVNPMHLFLGSNRDNIDDMLSKNRQAYGERSGRSKLTDADALAILTSDEPAPEIAKRYGVAVCTVHNVRLRLTWRHLDVAATPIPPLKDEKAPTAKLTNEIVLAVRASTATTYRLAKLYGVTERTIRNIRQGKAWKHLLPENVE